MINLDLKNIQVSKWLDQFKRCQNNICYIFLKVDNITVDLDPNQNSGFGSKFRIWSKIQDMDQNSGFGSKFRIWIKIQDLDQNSGFGSKFRIWIKIQDMDENSGYVSIFNTYIVFRSTTLLLCTIDRDSGLR